MTGKIICAICGNLYNSLSSHLRKHSISAKDYIKLYNSPIISEELRLSKSNKMLLHNSDNKYNHSEETKNKMRGKRPNISGDNNPFKKKYDSDFKFREKFKQTQLNIWQERDSTWRKAFSEKLSESMSKTSNLNKNIHKYHINNHWLSDKCVCGGYLRSSWEICLASVLDNSPLVLKYEIESTVIKYYDFLNFKYRHTKVDFLVYFCSGEKALIEVKPTALINTVIPKILGIECYCLEHSLQFLILSEDCIKDLERLNTFLLLLSLGTFYLKSLVYLGKKTPLSCSKFWGI